MFVSFGLILKVALCVSTIGENRAEGRCKCGLLALVQVAVTL